MHRKLTGSWTYWTLQSCAPLEVHFKAGLCQAHPQEAEGFSNQRQKKNVLQLVWTLPNLPEKLLIFDVGPRHRDIHLSPAAASLMGRWCWEEPCCPLPAPGSFLTGVHFHPCIPETANTHLRNAVIPDLEKHLLLSQPSTPPVAISLNSTPLPDTIYMARQTAQVFCHPEVQEMFDLMNAIKLIS